MNEVWSRRIHDLAYAKVYEHTSIPYLGDLCIYTAGSFILSCDPVPLSPRINGQINQLDIQVWNEEIDRRLKCTAGEI